MTAQTSSRFKILERPLVAPGKCAVCGAADKPVVDFGFDLDWYGVVYFCVECLTEIGKTIGMVHGEELRVYEGKFEQSLQHYLTQHDFALVTNEFLVDAVHSFDRLSTLAVSILPNLPLPDADELSESDAGESGELSATSVDEQPVAKQNSRKNNNSTGRKGRNLVSADSVDGTGDELFST